MLRQMSIPPLQIYGIFLLVLVCTKVLPLLISVGFVGDIDRLL